MQFARVTSANNCYDPPLGGLLKTADLDMLQLDYHPPALPQDITTAGAYFYAQELLEQIPMLHKALYLKPQLRLITNAGGSNTQKCIETLAEFFCEHDSDDLPITAIRGDNLLPVLDELLESGIELNDITTGEPITKPPQALLTAQVELGAGPFAVALNEGSRVMVAGCYDITAPAIAIAVNTHHWNWNQADDLAQLAVASQLPQMLLDIDARSELTLQPLPNQSVDKGHFHAELLKNAAEDHLHHADVRCHVRNFELKENNFSTYSIMGVTGEVSSEHWRLRLTYYEGYCSEALLQCPGDKASVSRVTEALHSQLQTNAKQQRTIKIISTFPADAGDPALLRVSCQSKHRVACEDFAQNIELLSTTFTSKIPNCDLLCFIARLKTNTTEHLCLIPREAVVVSVDTRPAQEWR